MNPVMTTWLPEDQKHEIGELLKSKDLYRIQSWTEKSTDGKGVLLQSPPVLVSEGTWAFTLQIYHERPAGENLATVNILLDGNINFTGTIISENFETGGWQRVMHQVSLKNSGNISFEVLYLNEHYIWTGAVNLQNISSLRPFYNIAHHCSTIKLVKEGVNKGANTVECDITPEMVDGKIEFNVKHSGDIHFTNWKDFGLFLVNLKSLHDSKKLALIMFDCKQVKGIDVRAYAKELASRITEAGLPSNNFAVSVPFSNAEEFFKGLDAVSFV